MSAEEGEDEDNLADVIGEAVGEGGAAGEEQGEGEEEEGGDLSDDEIDPFDDDSDAEEAEPGPEGYVSKFRDNANARLALIHICSITTRTSHRSIATVKAPLLVRHMVSSLCSTL